MNAYSEPFPEVYTFTLDREGLGHSVIVSGAANDANEVRELIRAFLLAVSYEPSTVDDILGGAP